MPRGSDVPEKIAWNDSDGDQGRIYAEWEAEHIAVLEIEGRTHHTPAGVWLTRTDAQRLRDWLNWRLDEETK